MAGYFTPVYICFGRPPQEVARLVDTTISKQQYNGLFR
jgi:hypothetical protein